MNLIRFLSFWILFEIYSSEAEENKTEEKKTPCKDDWTPYKDEKCLKYINRFENYAKAETVCKGEAGAGADEDPHLAIIDSKDKEKFILDLIPKTIEGNIWIGLKYLDDKKFGWVDNTVLSYTNWNDSDNLKYDNLTCAQLDVGNVNEKGKWLQASCVQYRGPVLCETIQKWTQQQTQVKIMNMIKSILPPDFIYVQFPKHKSPVEIWPFMEWEDVSHEYDSLFFRVIGKHSEEFGKMQNQSSPTLRINKRTFNEKTEKKKNVILDVPYEPEWVTAIVSPTIKRFEFSTLMNFTYRPEEVRPVNTAIKIWKRKN